MITKKYLFLVLSLVLLFSARSTFAARPSDFGLKEGDLISAIFSSDPDVYIINDQGYKRLFLNPEIFKFYKHLGGFASVKLVTIEVRDSFLTSGLFRNCEDKDDKVYGIDVEGEDKGELRWVNTSGEQAIKDDPNFFKKVFCINKKEFDWYPKATVTLNSVKEVPQYDRPTFTEARVSTQEKTETKAELKIIGQAVICHYPPGNITAFQTLTVGASALRAHLDHGDTIGACPSSLPTPSPAFTSTPTPAVSIPSVPVASSSNPFTPNLTPLVTITPTPTPAIIPTSPITVPTSPSPSPNSSASFTPTPSPTSTSSSAPQSPTSVTISSGTGKITVSWTASASRYNIYLSVNNGAYSFWSTNQIATTFDYSNVSSGNIYRFKIYGCNSDSVTCSTTGTESNTLTFASTLVPTTIPLAPSQLFVSGSSSTSIGIYWVDNSTNESEFRIERRFNSGSWSQIGTVAGDTTTKSTTNVNTTYTDSSLSGAGTYDYLVKACNSLGCSTESNITSQIINAGAPAAPSGLSATAGTNSIALSWTDNSSDEWGFRVRRRVQSGTSWFGAASVFNNSTGSAVSFADSYQLIPNTVYEYVVRSYNTYESADSNLVTVNFAGASNIDSSPPSTPTGLTATAVSSSQVNLSWNASTDNVGVIAYQVFRNELFWTQTANLTAQDIGLSPSTSYRYYVRALDAASYTSSPSTTVSVTTPGNTPTSQSNFPRNLSFGSFGLDVRHLQALLVNEINYPAHLITGYFGSITREAVKRLQEKYGIKPMSGYFGKITRQTLDALISD